MADEIIIHERWTYKMGSHDPKTVLADLLKLFSDENDKTFIRIMMESKDSRDQFEKSKYLMDQLGINISILKSKWEKIEREIGCIISKY
jgi:hypothetical protein